MNLVPGMYLKNSNNDKFLVMYKDPKSAKAYGQYYSEGGRIQSYCLNLSSSINWQPTGEVDWSITPTIPVEYSFPTDPQWRKGTKIGYLPEFGMYIRRNNGRFAWLSPEYVRIPQPEPVPTPKPVIDLEDDPPKPGDLYLIEQGKEVMFLCIDDEPGIETKWIWRLRNKPHYAFNSNRYGVVVSSLLENYNLISRKPVRHKEKFWVQIYPLRTNEVYLRVWDITDKNKFKPDEDCLACKEIEIEWTEGEGL